MTVIRRALFAVVLASLGCADGAREGFARNVVPVLERRCASAACHGVAHGEVIPLEQGFFVRLDAHGRVADIEGARESALARVSTRAPRASTLLRVPSPRWMGGGPHAGGALFTAPDDPELAVLLDWIALESRGGEDLDLTPMEQRFGAEVLPVLVERCAREGCHGPADIAFTAFAIHPVAGESALSDLDVRATRRAARKFLDLWGSDPRRSRLVRKALGELAGGLVHRGDVSSFFPEAPTDDPFAAPGLEAILSWAHAEREALGVMEGHAPSGILYVEGPPSNRAPYRIEPGELGSDLMLAGWPTPGVPRNLSAALHPEGPAEVRDPAVSHDASRVAFAMRRQGEDRFGLYELVLATGEWRRVTASDAPGSFVETIYAPDRRLIAVWDGHGELAADGPGVAPELVAVDASGALERLTYTPAPEVAPTALASGKTRGQLMFGTRRSGGEGVLFRFPLCHNKAFHGDPEYHVHFGASIAPFAPRVARDLPDGRQLIIALPSTDAEDDRGVLGVLDRSLGAQLDDPSLTSLAGYRQPFSWLDTNPRWRDIAPLPDGRVLGSRDDGEGASLVLARIDDGPGGARLGDVEPWLAVAGRSLRSPIPVAARPIEDDGHEPLTDPSLAEGFFALRDVAVLESLFGRGEPLGARPLREEIVGLRLIASSQASAREITRYADRSTTVGLSERIPAFVLAEVPLPADRSAWLRVPARVPIRIAFIDAAGMEVGASLDRWFYAEGAEVVPGGTNPPNYAHACSGCHGSATGDPRDAARPAPDAISAASLTLSTHRDRDRRRPIPPLAMEGGERVDFATAIAPRLASCIECHRGESPAGGLALEEGAGAGRFPAAYEALAARVDLESLRARRSPLMERLVGRELDAPGSPRGACPPGGADAELVRVFARWIEAGAFHDVSTREMAP